MMDALKTRLEALQTLRERLGPSAAIALATLVRNTVKANRKAIAKGRKGKREALMLAGHTKAAARRMTRGAKRRGSGISIDAVGTEDAIVLTASTMVQHTARDKDEIAAWLQLVAEYARKLGAE